MIFVQVSHICFVLNTCSPEDIETVFDYSDDSAYQQHQNEGVPYRIDFIDDTDYESLLYDFSSNSNSRCAENEEPSYMVSGTSSPSYSVGSTKTFNIVDSSNSWLYEPATVRATGTYCYVWVANSNFSNDAPNTYNDNKITQTQAQSLASYFDAIYQNETALLGSSYTTNPAPNIYIDPQNKISILVHDIKQDFQPGQNGGTFGQFWANDLYKTTAGTGNIAKSNQMELLYIDCHFFDRYPKDIISTMAHEFEHMLFYIHKTMNGIRANSTWFTEMGAMMAEDVMSNTIKQACPDFNIKANSTISRLYTFNYNYYQGGILSWQGDIASYARSGIFGCWLLRNYGGAILLNNIVNNGYNGKESISYALSSSPHPNDDFNDAFIKYALSFAQPDATYVTLNKSVTGGNYPLVVADPWDSYFQGYESSTNQLSYYGPAFVSENYTGPMKSYGFWITGWNSEQCTSVKLQLSKAGNEKNYIVIID